ncbi:MAG: hypothetical protein KUG76_02895, partial [Gammaproteobacteria bacterium]|nr:hypothetical protein [Gammaproteobacteria bacterium]
MIGNILSKVFGSKNDRQIKKMRKTVQQINSFEEAYKALSDEALQAKTLEFKEQINADEKSLDELLPEAF